jgi:hypothetical protein
MIEGDVWQILLTNPQFVAAIIAIVWNIGGYIVTLLHIKGLEKYEVTKLGETLFLFETLFTILSTVVGVPVKYVAIIAIVLVFIRSLKNALDNYAKALQE